MSGLHNVQLYSNWARVANGAGIYIFAKRLKTLKGLTPDDYICQQWQQHPERLLFDPSHFTLELDISPV